MKFKSTILLALVPCLGFAKLHDISELGIQLETPNAWTRDSEDTWGYLILDSDHRKAIRIHARSSDESTLLESANSIIQSIPKSDWPVFNKSDLASQHIPKIRVIELKECITQSGLSGLRVTTGNLKLKAEGRVLYPNVWHYLFQLFNGQTYCICVYNRNNQMSEEDADALVLPNLKMK